MRINPKPATGEFRALAEKADNLVGNLNTIVEENRENISSFSSTALPELASLIRDLRDLSQSISALAESLKENPSEIIFPRKDPEYEVE